MNPTLSDVSKGHSLFAFIDQYCLGETSGLSHNSAFHRLCSLMRKMDVRTAVVEDISSSFAEIAAEGKALNTYFGQHIEIKAHRITFLAEEVIALDSLPKVKNDNFLSSSIIINFKDPKKDWNSYLFSAIVTIPKIKNDPKLGDVPLLNNFIHIRRKFKREVIITEEKKIEFTITGSFFCQQNSVTSVCAHASLCMTLNNMEIQEELITPEDINEIIGVDHKTSKFGPEGEARFTDKEIKKVLSQYALTYELLNFFENPNIGYNEYIYRYIESRCPVLLIFTTDVTTSHVVPILGHTLNSDMWRPEAETAYSPAASRLDAFKSASEWVDHFIIHDDNFGMYLCLPVDALKRVTLPKYDPTFRAHYAVVVKPSDVTTPSREAENASAIITYDLLQWRKKTGAPLDTWADRLLERMSHGRPIVIRTFLVKKEDYIYSLKERDFENNSFSAEDKQILVKDLPDRFWLSEITLPYLYTANKNKIIDCFYGCNYPESKTDIDIYDRWLQIRFPFVLVRHDPSGTPSISELSVKSHYPLLRLHREHDLLDW